MKTNTILIVAIVLLATACGCERKPIGDDWTWQQHMVANYLWAVGSYDGKKIIVYDSFTECFTLKTTRPKDHLIFRIRPDGTVNLYPPGTVLYVERGGMSRGDLPPEYYPALFHK